MFDSDMLHLIFC